MASPQRSNQTRVHCLPLHIGSTRHEDRILGKSVPLVSWPIRSNRPCKTTYPRWSTHARKPDAIMSPMQRHETRSLAVNQRTGVTSALTALPGGFGVPTRLRPVRRLPSPLGRPVSLVVGGDGPPTYVGSGGGGACLSSSGPAHDMATPITRRAHIARSSPYCSEIDNATGMSAPNSRWRMSRPLSCGFFRPSTWVLQWGPVVVTGISSADRVRPLVGGAASMGSGRGDRNQGSRLRRPLSCDDT